MISIFQTPAPDDIVLNIYSRIELGRTVEIIERNDGIEDTQATVQIYRHMRIANTLLT